MQRARLVALSVGLALLALLLGLVACRGQERGAASDLRVSLQVEPSPPAVGPASLAVRLADASGTAVAGARVEIEGTMSHAGMVPVFADAVEVEAGRYVAEGFRFTMGGDWIMIVRATLADGTKLERRFDVKGVTGSQPHTRKGQSGGENG